jgi:hypothetical protein
MLASPVGLAGTTEPVEDCAPQPLPAASSHVEASTEVLITTQQVRLSTAAAVGVRRQSANVCNANQAATPREALRIPRERRHGPRDGAIVNVLISLGCAVVMAMFAAGIYNLQWRLERADYKRHFED